MPITQERMLALVGAAETYYEAYQLLRRQLRDLQRHYVEGTLPQLDYIKAIDDVLFGSALPEPHHAHIIGSEKTHFRLSAKGNERRKEKMRHNRLKQHYALEEFGQALKRPQNLSTPPRQLPSSKPVIDSTKTLEELWQANLAAQGQQQEPDTIIDLGEELPS